MKTLLFVSISIFLMNANATTSNFDCSNQLNGDRNNSICTSSLVSDAAKIKYNCAQAVKQQTQKEKAVR